MGAEAPTVGSQGAGPRCCEDGARGGARHRALAVSVAPELGSGFGLSFQPRTPRARKGMERSLTGGALPWG